MPPKILLQATNLSLGYGRRMVLRQVNLIVHAGEFWFFLGPNGEGKTTLLRAILGMLRPQAGRLWVDRELSQRDCLGFVPQRCDINPTLPTTVREFTLLGLVGLRTSPQERRERLAWALDKVGLGGHEDTDYWALSGGQRQRALVARALVRRPSVLMLDEPTNGLDVATEDSLLRFIADLNRERHLTVLFVTHNVAIAARYASHLAFFHGGHVVAGTRQDMLNRQTLYQVYGVGVEISSDASGVVAIRVCPVESDS
ncbi:MAG TPA: ABC transporter ATP-binding protein [Alphaproteobacteria bacterium]|nr:ABC transporter ATP-binding protein [Alphaproteobacteria bacterium]